MSLVLVCHILIDLGNFTDKLIKPKIFNYFCDVCHKVSSMGNQLNSFSLVWHKASTIGNHVRTELTNNGELAWFCRYWTCHKVKLVQLAGVAEYTDCFSAEGEAPPNECLGYDTKQSNGVAPLRLELRGMRSNHSLTSFLGPLWPGVVAPDRVLSISQIEINCVLMLNWIAWNKPIFRFNCV